MYLKFSMAPWNLDEGVLIISIGVYPIISISYSPQISGFNSKE